MTNPICQSCLSKGKGRVEMVVYYPMGRAKMHFRCPECFKVVE